MAADEHMAQQQKSGKNMIWQDFHFIRPLWLLALIPMLLILLLLFKHLKQQSGWRPLLAAHLYQHLITQPASAKAKPPLFLLLLCWLLTVVALAGPTWQKLPQPTYQLSAGKVILMDMSLSMRATDVKPDRLSKARFKAIDLAKALNEGETGLVAYAGDAFIISPLTSDVQNLATLIPSLSPEIMPVQGSDPYSGFALASELLINAGYQQGDIYWITDGVDSEQMSELREQISDLPYRVSALLIGTAQGAPILLSNGDFVKDVSGSVVIPKAESDNLKQITRLSGGVLAPLQNDNSDIAYLLEQAAPNKQADNQQSAEDQFGDLWQEMGPYLLLLVLPVAAWSFRRGLIFVLPLFMLPLYTPSASANWWDNMWKTDDQRAMQAFSEQNFSSAANTFNHSAWQGSAHYRNGDYQQAVDAFSQLDTADAWYNKGNALAKLGQIEQAINAYEEALTRQPDFSDASENKALLEQMREQNQQNQSNQQQQDQSDSNQEDQDQQQDAQQSDQTSDDSEQQPSEQQQDGSSEQSEKQQQESKASQESTEQQQAEDAQSATEQSTPQELQEIENEALTDEQKEQLQRMQQLLRKIPDDPAYLLKRKMQLEHQQRRNQRLPQQRNW
jgi:Ca-activated chloride channel family protein